MINPKELRLDNEVLYDDCYCTVVEIFKDKVGLGGYAQCVDIKDINGIPLTDEIMKRMDCAKVGNGWFGFGLEGFDFSLVNKGFTDDTGCRYNDVAITQLHQFQNFYFAKTGKELKIKL